MTTSEQRSWFFLEPSPSSLSVAWSDSAEAAKCQVTGGANKGKTGVYTDGGAWCSGSWGSTECNGASGSRCKAAKAIVVIDPGNPSVFDGEKSTMSIINRYLKTPEHGLVSCTIMMSTDSEVQANAICETIVAESLDDLKGSDNKNDRRDAIAVTQAISALPPR
jgi:hypothetical protein